MESQGHGEAGGQSERGPQTFRCARECVWGSLPRNGPHLEDIEPELQWEHPVNHSIHSSLSLFFFFFLAVPCGNFQAKDGAPATAMTGATTLPTRDP